MSLLHFIILFWLTGGGVVAWMSGKRFPEALGWFFYGLMLFPIAMVHVMIVRSRDHKLQCVHCAERVNAAAKVCPHCRLEAPTGVRM